MFRNLFGKRLLAHWLSLSVTHSSLDDTPPERFQAPPVVPREVDSIPLADRSHCTKGSAAIAEMPRPFWEKGSPGLKLNPDLAIRSGDKAGQDGIAAGVA